MATPAPNSVAANSFGGENPPSSCLDDPNFATICSFMQNFGEIIRIVRIPFDDLQLMLENTADVPPPLVQLHITLLRRVFKSVTVDKWERSLAKFGHTYCSQDAWEIERFGYKKAKIQTKLRLLKNLLEAQFDYNVKFKAEVNKLQASDLRLTPLGRDTEGQVYWYQVDEDANLRVYREDIDDETWEIVASDKDELEDLISRLQRGEVKKPEPEEAIIIPEEDSNSKDDIEPKEIILDTGKVEDEASNGEVSSESEEGMNDKQETKTVEPLVIKHSFNFSKIQNSEGNRLTSDADNVTCAFKSENESSLKMVFGVKKSKSDSRSGTPDLSQLDVKPCAVTDNVSINVKEEKALPIPVNQELAAASSSVEAPVPKSEPVDEVLDKVDHKSKETSNRFAISSDNPAISVEQPVVSPEKSVISTKHLTIPPEASAISTKKPTTSSKKAAISIVKPATSPEKSAISPEKPAISAEKDVISLEKPAISPEKDVISLEKPAISPEKPAISPEKPAISPEKPVISPEKSVVSTETPAVIPDKPVFVAETPAVIPEKPLISAEKSKISPETPKIFPEKPVISAEIPAIPQEKSIISSEKPNISTKKSTISIEKSASFPAKPTTSTEKPAISVEKPVITPTVGTNELKSTKLSGIFNNESSAKLEQQRVLQAKANKNLQKSAKVNSIVARLNKISPDQSAKTVAELLPPPPESSNLDSTPQAGKQENLRKFGEPVKDNRGHEIESPLPISENPIAVSKRVLSFASPKGETQPKPEELRDKVEVELEQRFPQTLQIPQENKTSHLEKFDQDHLKLATKPTKSCVDHLNDKTSESSLISIIPEPTAFSPNVSFRESDPTIHDDSKQLTAPVALIGSSSCELVHELPSIPKDKVTELQVSEPKVVPMIVENSYPAKKPEPSPVPEDTVVKSENKPRVDGSKKSSDKEESVIAEKVGGCDSEKSQVKEELVIAEKSWVCGSEKSPVKEELIVAEKTWVCGKEEKSVKEELVVKEKTWVCGQSESVDNQKSDFKGTMKVVESSTRESNPHVRQVDKEISPESCKTPHINLTTIPPPASEALKHAELVNSLSYPVCTDNDSDEVPSNINDTQAVLMDKELDLRTETVVQNKLPASQCSLSPPLNTKDTPAIIPEAKPEISKTDSEDTGTKVEPSSTDKRVDDFSTDEIVVKAPELGSDQPTSIISDDKEENASVIEPSITKTNNIYNVNLGSSKITPPESSPHNVKAAEVTKNEPDKKLTEELPTDIVSEKVTSNDAEKVAQSQKMELEKAKSPEAPLSQAKTDSIQSETETESEISSAPPKSKPNSSLVLYSESSESSNEAFADNLTKVSTSAKPEHSKDSGQNASVVSEKEVKVTHADQGKMTSVNTNAFSGIGNASTTNSVLTTGTMLAPKAVAITAEVVPPLPPTENTATKRKAEDELEASSKVRKLENSQKPEDEKMTSQQTEFNPIVGEMVEETVMTITGEGSGAMNEGGNSLFNPICGETIEEEIMLITGDGVGAMNQGSNENSPVSLSVPENVGSQNESIESDEEESRDAFPKARGRGGRRGGGRGRRGRPSAGATGGRNSQSSSTPRNSNSKRGSRGSREVARLGVSLESAEVNGDNERPVRASRRIAQIRLKEEEERRKLEEERLAQLKAAQMQKKAKQEERERKKAENPDQEFKVKKGSGKKSQPEMGVDYIPSPSESEESEEEGEGSDEFSGKLDKKRKRRRKNGKGKKGGNPWATSDEDEEEEQVEEEEEYHYEEEEEELVFKSDHEFSPESDLGEDDDAGPSRHARTAKQDKGDLFEEGNCCKCGKGDHPEWILLCDKCDKGWHASCLRPQLWVIPEGEWFCPPCQHNMLIENLSKNLVEYEVLLKKRENEILRKQRLAYVGISLDNVLPDKEPEVAEPKEELEEDVDRERERRRQRRRILSDEELSDFINDRDSDDFSRSRSGSGSEGDSDEPVYRLRARRTKKAFNFKEYDDMINSAIRVDDDEVEAEKMDLEDENEDDEDDKKLNGDGDDDKDSEGGVGGGKNDAYLKHLEKQAQEEDETDEELLDEKERLRRKELKTQQSQRKTRRRINDLDAYSEDEDSDDDFKASEAEDDEEELAEEGESEWSGDKMEDDSDDSIAKRARRKDRQGRNRRLGRREKYSDKGLVRRSTRKRRSRISYDESDEDEEEEDQNDKWQSEESEPEEESESNSESDDSTWGKRKKKALAAAKPKLADFVLGASSSSKGKGKGGVKRKRRKTDDDDTAWNSARGKKDKDEPIERRTRGRKINFKDILDSGESDDEGNVRPKRRPLSDSDDSRSPSSSRKLAEEIRAENARKDKEYEEAKKAEMSTLNSQSMLEEIVTTNDVVKSSTPPTIPEALTVAKMAESSVLPVSTPPLSKMSPAPSPLLAPILSSLVSSPSPNSIPPISSPLPIVSSPPSVTASVPISSNSSPVHPLSVPTPPSSLAAAIASVTGPVKQSVLPKTPPPIPFNPKSVPPNSVIGPFHPNLPRGSMPLNMSGTSLPSNMPPGHIPPGMPVGPISSNIPGIPASLNLPVGSILPGLMMGSSSKSIPTSIPPPVPVPMISEKKSKQSKGSRGSRGSKSDRHLPPPIPPPSDLELALTKPVKAPPVISQLPAPKSSSKKKDRDREASKTTPNQSVLLAGAGTVLPELLSAGLTATLRPGPGPPSGSSVPTSGGSSKKSKSGSSSSRATQQTTPPPVSQNLSPSLPIDIDRVPNPALFQGNPAIRSFHPMWGVRNPGPPPAGYSPPGSQVSAALGKPPPLNASLFGSQQGPPPRPGFSSPPPLRIPNPNSSPLQAFQHFKRDGSLGGPLYRLPPGQPGVSLANILPPGMMSPHAGGPERFFGAPGGYPHPYGLLPPHTQGPPQALFPYDYRPPEPPFKDEPAPAPPRTTASSLPTPVPGPSSSPPPTTSASVPLPTKDEGPSARDSEFGGLVSYFSSQRSEEDMDS